MNHQRLKYGNKITVVHGIKFRSKGEATRYCELLILLKAGEISDLKLQVKHILYANGQKVGTYTSDFEYMEGDKWVIEDFKGARTALFILKWNIMKVMFSLENMDGRPVLLKLTGKTSKSRRGSPRGTSASRPARKT